MRRIHGRPEPEHAGVHLAELVQAAEGDRTGVIHQFVQFLESYPDVLMATVALVLIALWAAIPWRMRRTADTQGPGESTGLMG